MTGLHLTNAAYAATEKPAGPLHRVSGQSDPEMLEAVRRRSESMTEAVLRLAELETELPALVLLLPLLCSREARKALLAIANAARFALGLGEA
jgi:hypothetical protein